MGLRHRKPEPPTVYVGDHTDRLSGIRSHIHEDRPSREDLALQGSQVFKFPVELPRFMKMKRER